MLTAIGFFISDDPEAVTASLQAPSGGTVTSETADAWRDGRESPRAAREIFGDGRSTWGHFDLPYAAPHPVLARAGRPDISRVPVMPPTWRSTPGSPHQKALLDLLQRVHEVRYLREHAPTEDLALGYAQRFEPLLARYVRTGCTELELRAADGPPAPVTAESEALEAAVHAAPDDDAARQVYADWLTEHGDPRGELITLQLAGREASRARTLVKRNIDRWLGPLRPAIRGTPTFRRGFLASCTTTDHAADHVDDPAWATVEALKTRVAPLVVHPGMRALREVTLSWRTLGALGPLGGAAPGVEVVRLTGAPDPSAWPVLAMGRVFPSLRELHLPATRPMPRGPQGERRPPRVLTPELDRLPSGPGLSGLLRLRLSGPAEALDLLDAAAARRLFGRHAPRCLEISVGTFSTLRLYEGAAELELGSSANDRLLFMEPEEMRDVARRLASLDRPLTVRSRASSLPERSRPLVDALFGACWADVKPPDDATD